MHGTKSVFLNTKKLIQILINLNVRLYQNTLIIWKIANLSPIIFSYIIYSYVQIVLIVDKPLRLPLFSASEYLRIVCIKPPSLETSDAI